MMKTVLEIAVSSLAAAGAYFLLSALGRRWAARECRRMDIKAEGGRLPCRLILRTDGSALDVELRACGRLVESGCFSAVVIDAPEVEKIKKEVERISGRFRVPVEYVIDA